MRAILTLCTIGAVLALAAGKSSAQQDANYCLTGGTTDGMDCSYATMAACQAAMTGTIGEACVRNPNSDSGIPAPSPR